MRDLNSQRNRSIEDLLQTIQYVNRPRTGWDKAEQARAKAEMIERLSGAVKALAEAPLPSPEPETEDEEGAQREE